MEDSSNPPVFAATAHDFSGSEEAMEMDDATVHKPAKISGFSADEAMELLDESCHLFGNGRNNGNGCCCRALTSKDHRVVGRI